MPFARTPDVHCAHYPVLPGLLLFEPLYGRLFHLPVVPAALLEDIVVPHGLNSTVQVRIVLIHWEDVLVILPSGVDGAVDIGVHDLSVRLSVQPPLYAFPGEGCLVGASECRIVKKNRGLVYLS